MALGWAPNDGLDLDSEEGKALLAAEAAAAAAAGQAPPVYNQQQFVEPGQTDRPAGLDDRHQRRAAGAAGGRAAAAAERLQAPPQQRVRRFVCRRAPRGAELFFDNHDVAVAPREIAGLARGKPVWKPARPPPL